MSSPSQHTETWKHVKDCHPISITSPYHHCITITMSPRHRHHVTLFPTSLSFPLTSSHIHHTEPQLHGKDCHRVTTTTSPHYCINVTMSPRPQRLPLVPPGHPRSSTRSCGCMLRTVTMSTLLCHHRVTITASTHHVTLSPASPSFPPGHPGAWSRGCTLRTVTVSPTPLPPSLHHRHHITTSLSLRHPVPNIPLIPPHAKDCHPVTASPPLCHCRITITTLPSRCHPAPVFLLSPPKVISVQRLEPWLCAKDCHPVTVLPSRCHCHRITKVTLTPTRTRSRGC